MLKTQTEQNFEEVEPRKVGYHSQKDLLLRKLRTTISTGRGIRGYISLKRQFKVLDAENRGWLDLNEWLQAFDDLKIANVHSGDLKMLFGIYDLSKLCQINYQVFLWDLYEPLNQIRSQCVRQAFEDLDNNASGKLEMNEIKGRFNPARHPEVLKGVKTVEEARFEFYNLFTTLHSANNGFNSEAKVTFNDFNEWHTIANTQIERDEDFKSFIVGVWSLDTNKENTNNLAGGIENVEIARQADRNARQMYHHDFHRKTFGNE